MEKRIGSRSLSRFQRGSLQDRWQVITLVTILLIAIVLSITTEGCYERSKDEEVGSSAPPEVRTLTFIDQPVTNTAGMVMTAVTVELLDQYNTVMSGTVVSITTTNSSIILNGTLTSTSNASGIATFNDLMITKTDTYTLKAYVGAIIQTSDAFNITASAPDNLAFVQQPTNTGVGAAFNPVVTVRIRDVYNNAVITATNPVSITVSSGTLGGGPTDNVTAVNGIATFTGVTVDTTLTNGLTLTATSAGLTSATSTTFDIVPGPVNNYLVVPASSSVVTGSDQTATVTARDAYGNTVTTAFNTITITKVSIIGSPTVTFYTDGIYSAIKSSPVIYSLSSGVATIWYRARHDGTAPDTFTITVTDAASKYGTSGTVTVTN